MMMVHSYTVHALMKQGIDDGSPATGSRENYVFSLESRYLTVQLVLIVSTKLLKGFHQQFLSESTSKIILSLPEGAREQYKDRNDF